MLFSLGEYTVKYLCTRYTHSGYISNKDTVTPRPVEKKNIKQTKNGTASNTENHPYFILFLLIEMCRLYNPIINPLSANSIPVPTSSSPQNGIALPKQFMAKNVSNIQIIINTNAIPIAEDIASNTEESFIKSDLLFFE